MSKLMLKRCESQDITELECYKFQYIDNKIDVAVWGKKRGQGIYFQVADPYAKEEKWYELVFKHPKK